MVSFDPYYHLHIYWIAHIQMFLLLYRFYLYTGGDVKFASEFGVLARVCRRPGAGRKVAQDRRDASNQQFKHFRR